MSTDLKVFTLNCWGIPFVSKDREARMKAIAEVIATSDYDIVCLQEVWTDADYFTIRDKASGVFPFSHYFYSGVVGSGICILSRYQFKDVFFHQWPINGYIHKIQHGDWFGGKGVGLCRISLENFNINIYSAHLHAEYNRNCDEYQAHRVLQAYDTAQFIQLTSGAADLVVLAGDLNTEPEDLAYRILTKMTGLTDAFTEADEFAQETSGTNECSTNSYTSRCLNRGHGLGNRIDYIMYRCGANVKVDLRKYCLPLPDRVPDHLFSYSDHEAISVSLTLTRSEVDACKYDRDNQLQVLRKSLVVCNEAIHRLKVHKRLYWCFSLVLLGFLITTIVTDAPFGLAIVYHILRVFLTGMMCYTIVMATLWNYIESNAVVAGKCAMEVNLGFLSQTREV